MTATALQRAALIGFVAGMRTSAPLVAVARHAKPWEWFAFLGECVVDKIPAVPSRLEAGGRIGRLGTSMFAAYRDAAQLDRGGAALTAGLFSILSAKIAHDLRAELVRKLGCADILIAALEDAVALACIVRLRSTQGGVDA